MKQLPENVTPYKRTPEFNENTIPKGLLRDHQTKDGTWAKINILEGQLLYTINEPELEKIVLDKDNFGVIEPAVLHKIKPVDSVRLYIEFYR